MNDDKTSNNTADAGEQASTRRVSNAFPAFLGCVAVAFVVASLFGVGMVWSPPKKTTSPVELVPVSGVVLLDDEPVAGAFVQVAPSHLPVAQGFTDAEGRFTLGTFTRDDGCPTGTHPTAVVAYRVEGEDIAFLVPEPYQDLATTQLEVTIDGPTDSLRIDL